MSAPGGTSSARATASIVVAPGVCSGRGSGSPSGSPGTGWAVAEATSTLAAYPASERATSFSPAGQGAMYSWAPKPPIIPTSDSTRYHSRPLRSKIRSYASDVELVGAVQALAIAVEAVGVLHDELARAQHPGARPRLVALLGLEVVQQLGQVAVGADLAGDVEGEVLLVRHRQHELGPAPVLELEHLVDVVAPAGPPQLSGLEHRHQHLPAADGVQLLAHDLLHPPVRAPPGRQPGPQARAHLPGQPGPHRQPVGGCLGVRGRLTGGGQEIAREAGHRGRV